MAQKIINIGVSPNDGTGDTLRVGGDKINDNFSEVYPLLNNFATLTNVGVSWSETVDASIIDWINTNGLTVGKDEVMFLSVPQFYLPVLPPTGGGASSSQPPSWTGNLLIWTAGAGSWGTVNGNTINTPKWFLVSKTTPEKNTYPLGEIATTPIEDAVNASGPYEVAPGESTIFTAQRSGEDFAYLYIGNANGEIGLGAIQTTADDFINLNEQQPDPIDPNDYVTIGKFDTSLYDTATTGFSTDLSNFTSLTEKFYVLMIDDGTNPVTYYFASKETNTEDFDGSRIYISASGTKHDLGAPTVTQNGYHFWDIGDLGVPLNAQTGDWAFQAWFHTGEVGNQFTTDQSLYLDPVTSELRSNVNELEETFTFESSRTFNLTNDSVEVSDVYVNRANKLFLLSDYTLPTTQSIEIDTNYPLYAGDKIRVKYKYLITP